MSKRRPTRAEGSRSVWSRTITTIAFVTVFVSIVWLLVDPGFEPLLTTLASFASIVAYFGLKNSKYQAYLDQVMAVLVLIVVLVAALLIGGKTRQERKLALAPPTPGIANVDITWFETDGYGVLRLVDPTAISLPIGSREIQAQAVSIPINLAIRNIGNRPLEVVRVELAYDSSLEVRSSGKAKIDPNNKVLIYEHDIGYLENVDNYTPLETIDTVVVPFTLVPVETIALTKDGVPMLVRVVAGLDRDALLAGRGMQGRTIQFRVRVFSKGNVPLEQTIAFNLESHVDLVIPEDAGNTEAATPVPADIEFFTNMSTVESMTLLDGWKVHEPTIGLLEYQKIRYEDGIYQLVFVNQILRLINADVDSDGNLDYVLYDGTFDQLPDGKIVYHTPVKMIDWPKEAAR